MNDIPENKQKRLMSLNQDVLAVSPASTSQHQAINTPRQMPRQSSADATGQPQAASRGRGVAAALGGLTVVMLILLGVVSMTLLKMQQRVDELQRQLGAAGGAVDLAPLEERLNALEALLAPVDERLTALEQQPVVVQGDSGRTEAASQAGLAQANARLRKLDIEISRLSSEMGSTREQVSGVLARVQKAETLVASQRDALAALTPKIDALAASSGQADSKARLAEIESRLERTNNDIRSLYRMLEMGR